MRILVLGKNGMLGHMVYNYFLEKKYEVYGTTRKDGLIYDANNMEELENIIKKIKPDVVINCIGILNKMAEENKMLAVKLNSLLPHYIDSLSSNYNFKFIHISTDCVFNGKVGKYIETATPDATSFYGRSKALGEIINESNLTLRTSIVGPDNNPQGIGLFKWFMLQKGVIDGYSKVIWTGVTTLELARVIEKAIAHNLVGLHHVVNNDFISKKDLLELFKKYFAKDIEIRDDSTNKSEKTLIRTNNSFDFNIPSYEEMIKEMRQWVDEHPKLYPLIINNIDKKVKIK